MTEVQQAFMDLHSFVADYDPISLLSQLTLTFLFVPADQFQSEASTSHFDFPFRRRVHSLAQKRLS